MVRSDLDVLAQRFGTDKGTQEVPSGLSPKAYTLVYEALLAGMRDAEVRLLEIGLGKTGASVKMWSAWMPQAQIYGVDVRAGLPALLSGIPQAHIYVGDQGNPLFMRTVALEVAPLDVVVDDGGHRTDLHKASYNALWPVLKRGGFYFIEDLHATKESVPWLRGLGAEFAAAGRLAILRKE